MVREVHEQLRAMVPGFVGANGAFSIQDPRQYDCRPVENRIWDTDPRKCASKVDTRRDSEQKLFRSALKVVPRLIHSFCKSDAVSHLSRVLRDVISDCKDDITKRILVLSSVGVGGGYAFRCHFECVATTFSSCYHGDGWVSGVVSAFARGFRWRGFCDQDATVRA